MPVLLSCSCGKQLRVPDDYAGRRVKCPSCGESQLVPEAAGAPASERTPPPRARTDDMIRFACECGKQMQAKASYAGRTTHCPACEAQVLIPGGEDNEDSRARSRFRADRPEPRKVRTLAGRDDRDDRYDRDDDDFDDRPRKRTKKRKVWPWVVGGIALLLLLVGGGIGAWLWFSGGIADDLALVPGDAQGFLTLRPADVWKLDWTQQFLAELKKQSPEIGDVAALSEAKLGLSPSEVERATLVFNDVQKNEVWGIIYTVKAYDKSKILSKLPPGGREAMHAGKSYHVVSTMGEPVAVHFVNDRTFLIGPEPGIKSAVEKVGGKHIKGPLDDALKLASKKHHLVGGLKAPPELTQARGKLPPQAAAFASLLEFESGYLVFDINKNNSELEVSLSFPSSGKAKDAKDALEGIMSAAKMFMPAIKQQMAMALPPGQAAKMNNDIDAALKSLKIDRSGSTVSVSLKGAMGDPAQAVTAFKGGMAGFPLAGRPAVRKVPIGAGPGFGPRPIPVGPRPGFGPRPQPVPPAGAGGLDPVAKVRLAAQRTQSSNNLKQLVLAMHQYHDKHGHLPPAATSDATGRRKLLSWRVELLPFLGEEKLYREFHHDEPWNSPHNMSLVNKMPKVFGLPGQDFFTSQGRTYYKVFTGPKSPFKGKEGVGLAGGFPDGTSNTILIVESSSPVVWTQPLDIRYTSARFARSRLGNHWKNDTFHVAMADGVVRAVSTKVSDDTLDHAIRPDDGMALGKDW